MNSKIYSKKLVALGLETRDTADLELCATQNRYFIFALFRGYSYCRARMAASQVSAMAPWVEPRSCVFCER